MHQAGYSLEIEQRKENHLDHIVYYPRTFDGFRSSVSIVGSGQPWKNAQLRVDEARAAQPCRRLL